MLINMWIIGIIILIWIAAIYVGSRYPDPQRDWPYDLKRTVRIFLSIILFIIMAGLIYLVSLRFSLPPPSLIFTYFLVPVFLTLILIGLFFPNGFRSDIIKNK